MCFFWVLTLSPPPQFLCLHKFDHLVNSLYSNKTLAVSVLACVASLYTFFFLPAFLFVSLCSDCPTLVTFTWSLLISPCCVFKPIVFLSSLCQCNFTEACFSSSLTVRRLSACRSHLSDCDPLLCFYALMNTVKLNLFCGWHLYLGPSLSRVCFFLFFSQGSVDVWRGNTFLQSKFFHWKDASPMCLCNTFPLFLFFFQDLHTQ